MLSDNPGAFADKFAGIEAAIPYVSTDLDRVVISFEDRNYDFAVQAHDVPIRNGRLAASAPDLDCEGFALLHWPSRVVAERRDELIRENSQPREEMALVNADYLAELVPLIAELSGAREVFAQYDTITVRFSKRASQRSWMSTAGFAHLDFERSEIDRLLAETIALTGREVRPFRRQILYQTWRVITDPPQDMPLALCDGRTVSETDVIPMDFHGPEGSRNEFVRSRACRFNPQHRWYYFPDMRPEEVLVFKGFDSDVPDARNAMHTAFDDMSVDSAVPRGSIECRFIALFD